MTVYVLQHEYQDGDGGPNNVIVAIFGNEADAIAARQAAVEEAQADGRKVWREPTDDPDWDDDFTVDGFTIR